MRALRIAWTAAPFALAAAAVACSSGTDFAYDGGTDTGDTETVDTGTGSETETETDTGTGTEIDTNDTTPDEAAPGQPCWKDSFGPAHPNAGLPDCGDGYTCVGNETGAWCSQTCDATGDIDAEAGPFESWCCGEFSNPCDPIRFWLPAELSSLCVPRTAGLAEACAEEGTWPSSDVRCAPRCDGTTLIGETICEAGGDTPFCTFPCAVDTDCFVASEFLDGCCLLYGATDECTPAALCE